MISLCADIHCSDRFLRLDHTKISTSGIFSEVGTVRKWKLSSLEIGTQIDLFLILQFGGIDNSMLRCRFHIRQTSFTKTLYTLIPTIRCFDFPKLIRVINYPIHRLYFGEVETPYNFPVPLGAITIIERKPSVS